MIPGGLGTQRAARPGGAQAQEPVQTGPRREVRWLVAVEGNAPLKIVVSSEKGGTAVRELTVR